MTEQMIMKIAMPATGEYAPSFAPYIQKTQYEDLVSALKEQEDEVMRFLNTIPEEKGGHRYAEDKWSIKEVIVHLSDAERVFAYRALRFGRNDKTELSGFEEDAWAPESNADSRTLKQVIEEWRTVREATLTLFSSFTNDMVMREGKANGKLVSVRALGGIIIGHTTHHLQVIRERYL